MNLSFARKRLSRLLGPALFAVSLTAATALASNHTSHHALAETQTPSIGDSRVLDLSQRAATTRPTAGAPDSTPAAARADRNRNPLAGRTWGVYKGPGDQAWEPYVRASGREKEMLGYIALKPKAKWFGFWTRPGDIETRVRNYVTNSQNGDREALVQMSIFAMVPWEHEACRRLPTRAEQATYKRWIDNFAQGVGDAHAAIIMQPDGPFALCAPGGSTLPSSLIAYGTRTLSALPNTSVYVEVGAHDWPFDGPLQGGPEAAARIAIRGGVKHARGIALNGTHYSATRLEIKRAVEVIDILNAKGIKGKKAVINTATNGHPFPFGTYTGPDADNAFVCQSKAAPLTRTCVTLGIPPTTNVDSPRWRLPALRAAQARRYVDGYIWFGRPWLYRQNDPFVKSRALDLVRSTPYSRY